MSCLPICNVSTVARQLSRYLALLCMVTVLLGFHGNLSAEGTKQLEPKDTPPTSNSFCKLALSQSSVEYRIPFALLDCDKDLRLNIHISDFSTEKIYLGFGNVTDYSNKKIYTDVQYQVKDPDGIIVKGYSLKPVPNLPGSDGFINNRDEVDIGPDISSPQGYKPLVLTPEKNGDYFIEFKISDAVPNDPPINEIRVFRYFDITVAKGETPIPGRLWSKAWQLSSGNVMASVSASFSLFYIYTNDSIVTRFDCNGLAGGVWTIYSNEWGCSTTGAWSDRRRSAGGNASVHPEYKIFLNDPDSTVFPSGHIGKMLDFRQFSNECDSVITFAATVTTGGNIELLVDIPPLNPNSIGPEDVKLTYPVNAGFNILLPSWDGKDGNGQPIANGTKVTSHIRFLNGLSNVPLYDVEENPKGFKVDLQRPKPASGSVMLKLYWDDTKLPARYYPGTNTTEGCSYTGIDPHSGCHDWSRFLVSGDTNQFYSLGDTNTINTWWYLTTDQIIEAEITLKIRPSSGQVSGQADVCKGQTVAFTTSTVGLADQYVWRLLGNGFSNDSILNVPDTTFTYAFNESMPAGEYVVSVMGRNLACGDGGVVGHKVTLHNRPKAGFANDNSCQGAEIIFTDQSVAADANLNDFSWMVNSATGYHRALHGNPVVMVFDTAADYRVRLLASDLFGCSDTASRMIAIKPKPESAFEYIENPQINGELHFDNQSTGAVAYLWDFGNTMVSTLTDPDIKYEHEGNYTIRLVANNVEGCKDTAVKQYYYMPGLWLPNAFSPNNNDHNEVFGPVTQRTTLEPYQLLIFDKWGQVIYKTTDPSEGWDGKYKGSPCPAGSYSYLIQYREAKIEGSGIVTRRGMVSLIR